MATVNTNGTKLTDEQRDAIEDAALVAGLDVDSSYSGRGMFGDQCFAVVGKLSYFAEFMADLGHRAPELALRLSHKVREDSLGRSTIYYFPGFEF